MEVALQTLLPKMLREGIEFELRQFGCKTDLLKPPLKNCRLGFGVTGMPCGQRIPSSTQLCRCVPVTATQTLSGAAHGKRLSDNSNSKAASSKGCASQSGRAWCRLAWIQPRIGPQALFASDQRCPTCEGVRRWSYGLSALAYQLPGVKDPCSEPVSTAAAGSKDGRSMRW